MTFAVAEYYIISRPSERQEQKSESFASLANYLIKAYASTTTEEPEQPENFFQLSVGLLEEEEKKVFQEEARPLGFLLFLQVHE